MRLTKHALTFLEAQYRAILSAAYKAGIASTLVVASAVGGGMTVASAADLVIDSPETPWVLEGPNDEQASVDSLTVINKRNDNLVTGFFYPEFTVKGDLTLSGAGTGLTFGARSPDSALATSASIMGKTVVSNGATLSLEASPLLFATVPNATATFHQPVEIDGGSFIMKPSLYNSVNVLAKAPVFVTHGGSLQIGKALNPEAKSTGDSYSVFQSEQEISVANAGSKVVFDGYGGVFNGLVSPKVRFTDNASLETTKDMDKAFVIANDVSFDSASLTLGEGSHLYINGSFDYVEEVRTSRRHPDGLRHVIQPHTVQNVSFNNSSLNTLGGESQLFLSAQNLSIQGSSLNLAKDDTATISLGVRPVKERGFFKTEPTSFSLKDSNFVLDGTLNLTMGDFALTTYENTITGEGTLNIGPKASLVYTMKSKPNTRFGPISYSERVTHNIYGKLKAVDGILQLSGNNTKLHTGGILELDGSDMNVSFTMPALSRYIVHGIPDRLSDNAGVTNDASFYLDDGAEYRSGKEFTRALFYQTYPRYYGDFKQIDHGSRLSFEFPKDFAIPIDTNLALKFIERYELEDVLRKSNSAILDFGTAYFPELVNDKKISAEEIRWSDFDKNRKKFGPLANYITNAQISHIAVLGVPPKPKGEEGHDTIIAGALEIYDDHEPLYMKDNTLLALENNLWRGDFIYQFNPHGIVTGSNCTVLVTVRGKSGQLTDLTFTGTTDPNKHNAFIARFRPYVWSERNWIIVDNLITNQKEGDPYSTDVFSDRGMKFILGRINYFRNFVCLGPLDADVVYGGDRLETFAPAQITKLTNVSNVIAHDNIIIDNLYSLPDFISVEGKPFFTEGSIALNGINLQLQDDIRAQYPANHEPLPSHFRVGPNTVTVYNGYVDNLYAVAPFLKYLDQMHSSLNPNRIGTVLVLNGLPSRMNGGFLVPSGGDVIVELGNTDAISNLRSSSTWAGKDVATMFLGANTLTYIPAHSDWLYGPESHLHYALATYADNFVIVADGGIVMFRDMLPSEPESMEVAIFHSMTDKGTITIVDTEGNPLPKDAGGVFVISQNDYMQGYITNDLGDHSSGIVKLKTNDVQARTIMKEASDDVFNSILRGQALFTRNSMLNYNMAAGHGHEVEQAARFAAFGGVVQATQQVSDISTSVIASRLSFAQANSELISASNGAGNTLWVTPLYQKYNSDGFASQNFSYGTDIELKGAMLGLETKGQNWTFGVAGGIGDGDADGQGKADNIKNDFDFYTLSAYAGYQCNNFGISATLTYSELDNELDGHTNFTDVSSTMDSKLLEFGLRAQYDFAFDNIHVIPSLGVTVSSLDVNDYAVSGGEKYLESDSSSLQQVKVPVAVTFASDLKTENWTLQPQLSLKVTGNFGDTDFNNTVHWSQSNLQTNLETEVCDDVTYGVALGLVAQHGDWQLSLNGDYTGSENSDSFGVKASASFTF